MEEDGGHRPGRIRWPGGCRTFPQEESGAQSCCDSSGRVIGAVLCGHDGRRGYLHHLAVARKWRRQGVGRALVVACLEKLRSEGIPKCNIFLFASNAQGRAFWRRLGWNVRADLRLVQRETGAPTGL